MVDFFISGGNSTTFIDTTPNGGFAIDFVNLDNSLSLQVNGVQVFIGGPAAAPHELEFQIGSTPGQTVGFADGDLYETDTPAIWQLDRPNEDIVARIEINPDGTVALFGVKFAGGPLEPLIPINGLSVNTAAIAAAWNTTGTNTITLNQDVTGPTLADGEFIDVPCFASGTMITTPTTPVAVEALRAGDTVLTYDRGHQPIRWIGTCHLTDVQLAAQPRLRPIVIRADALGRGYPKQDLIVSPQHRVLVSSAIAMRMFDCADVLVPAGKLLCLDGIDIMTDTPAGITYHHILFDQHEVIWSNGAATESLFTGPQALKSVSPEAREEIMALFPACCDPDFAATAARYIPKKGKLMRKLAMRHKTNGKPLFSLKEDRETGH